MRILLVSDFYPPVPGGLSAHVAELARALAAAGDDVMVVTADGGPDPAGTIEVQVTGTSVGALRRDRSIPFAAMPPPWRDRRLAAAVGRAVSGWRPDVVHAHGWAAFSAPGTPPLVVTLHDYGLLCPMRSLFDGRGTCAGAAGLRCVGCSGANQSVAKRSVLAAAIVDRRRALIDRAAAFVAVSGAVADRHAHLVAGSRLHVIHNFIADPPVELSHLPGCGAGQRPPGRLLFVGPADPYKGLPAAEALLSRLRARPGLGATGLDHVGGDTPGDPMAGDGPGGIRRWGRLERTALAERYRAAAVVVAPALWSDPCPTVVLEAMAAGRPVAGFAAGGLPELVGDTGVVAPTGDVETLADQVEALLRDPRRTRALGRAARRRAAAFTTSEVVPRLRGLYASVAGRPAVPS